MNEYYTFILAFFQDKWDSQCICLWCLRFKIFNIEDIEYSESMRKMGWVLKTSKGELSIRKKNILWTDKVFQAGSDFIHSFQNCTYSQTEPEVVLFSDKGFHEKGRGAEALQRTNCFYQIFLLIGEFPWYSNETLLLMRARKLFYLKQRSNINMEHNRLLIASYFRSKGVLGQSR